MLVATTEAAAKVVVEAMKKLRVVLVIGVARVARVERVVMMMVEVVNKKAGLGRGSQREFYQYEKEKG